MSVFPNQYPTPGYSSRPLDYAGQDQSQVIARFMNGVYAWMCAGLAMTATVAWWCAGRVDVMQQVGRGFFLLFLVELGLVIAISSAINRINAAVATLLFMVYAALNGLTLAGIFFIYTHGVLASAFAVTAGMFGATSLYGFFTKRDLTGLGSLMFMGLMGLVIASIVSMFWHPTLFSVLFNYLGVVIFVGLTAYDTQRLKVMAIQTAGNGKMAARLAVNGALSLYLNFLNLFLFILRIMGGGRDR